MTAARPGDADHLSQPGRTVRHRLARRPALARVALAGLALAIAGCATRGPATYARPHGEPAIVDWPISFPERRVELTREYVREHYGFDPDEIAFTPRVIVLHWTAIEDLGATFRTFDPVTLGGRPDLSGAGAVNVSSQFVVGKDGTIYRLMPETWMARHVIGLNWGAIGVENVGSGTSESSTLTDDQVAANIALVRYLVRKYPTIEYLIGHHEYRAFEGHPLWLERDPAYRTDKIDPGDAFMAAVRAGVEELGLNGVP